ncbi:MAG: ABC transporter substrate-binding protein, partial [Salinibacterium sp.]|nr:ABC transporter substrate-binding protein [Salinibacterium sp.]
MTTTSRRRGRLVTLVGLATAGALILTGCATAVEPTAAPKPRPDLSLSIGALLPQTGALASFGPAAQAGVDLAVADINAVDVGITVTSMSGDSSDATTDLSITAATQLLDQDVSVIVGAISDGVSKKVIDQIVGAGVIQMSPGSSSLDFSRYADSDLYWRTSPSCAREGAAPEQHIADSGAKTLGIVYQTGYCDPGLPEAIA